MENLVRIKYFCCENRVVIRIIEDINGYSDTLEFYDPITEGWVPNKEWYYNMFVSKKISFREINKEEAIEYIKISKEYYKREKGVPVYLRRIYGIDLEVLDDKTGKWQEVENDEWYQELDECKRVSENEVTNYIENLFSKKIIR